MEGLMPKLEALRWLRFAQDTFVYKLKQDGYDLKTIATILEEYADYKNSLDK